MTTETSTQEVTKPESSPKEITSPDISFSEYEKIRRGEVVSESAPSAPEAKVSEQKESGTSESLETEEKEVETTDSEESEASEQTENKDEKTKKKGGFQRRIDKLNARFSAKEQEAEYWKQQALKGASEAKTEPKLDSKPVATEGEPDPAKFETHAAYVKAVARYEAEQVQKEISQKQEQTKLKESQSQVVQTYNDRVKEFEKTHSDFKEALEELDGVQISPAVKEIILTSEIGPALAYELAKNPEEFERVCKLSPFAAAREMGKIESRIESKASVAKQETKKITNAPKPLDPISGGQAPAAKKKPEEMSFTEYEKYRRDQLKRRA